MILSYPTFYRKFGIRMLSQLMTPILSDTKFLDLPIDSIYHYTSYDAVTTGPANDNLLFKNNKRPIPVHTAMELTEFLGHPRRQSINPQALIRDYMHTHRRMRMLKSLDTAVRDKPTPIVYNYALLSKVYRYPQSLFMAYYRWHNVFASIITQIADVAPTVNRQHYLFAGVPLVIPSATQLSNAALTTNPATLKPFKDPNSLLLLELWKWLSVNRESSLLSRIPKNKIHLVNIVFTESGKWCVLNLGILNSYRQEAVSDVEIPKEEDYVIRSKQTVNGMQLSKRLLRLQMSLMEARTLASKDAAATPLAIEDPADVLAPSMLPESSVDIDPELEDEDDVSTHEVASSEIDYIEPYQEKMQDAIALTGTPVEADEELTSDQWVAQVAADDSVLDEDLTALDSIAQSLDADDPDATQSLDAAIYVDPFPELEDSVISVCSRLAQDGMLSAGEYRKFAALATSYKDIKSPDGTPLNKFMVVSPQSLVLKQEPIMPDSPMVFDKSMLHASLDNYDSQYVDHILPKHYASIALSMQKAGIAVTGYKVEDHVDILGGYSEHAIKLHPVIGAPSTIRLKVPIVNSEGTYRSSDVTYRLRKQRVD